MRRALRRLHALLLALIVAACGGSGPRPVAVGEDTCAYCRMTVIDERFAAQAVTRTGRVHVFDSIDCLVGYVRGAEAGSLATLWVTDAAAPGEFVAAGEAVFLVGSSLRGPMGHVVAFAADDAAKSAQARFGGTIADWARVLADSTTGGH